jgi:hypothetical protein
MATHAPTNPPLGAAPAAVAIQRLFWAQRRRATASAEAAQARQRLAAAEEQVRAARQAARAAGGLTGRDEMVGMGYFADEVDWTEAA